MATWKKTACVCCAQNCGLEMLVEENRIVKVRPDRDNLRSEGYCCRKGMKIAHYQHNADRLKAPLKRVGDNFVEISWDEALDEIAAKLKQVVDDHGPRALAYMGGGGQGCHFEAALGVRLLRSLGSFYHYSPLAQELTGYFWVNGRGLGRQYLGTIPDIENTDMLIAWGWNGWLSHQMPQARRHLKRISDDPDKLLVVVDPRRSETAEKADMHLAIRPGTDTLLLKALITVILEEGLSHGDYIAKHAAGHETALPLFEGFDYKSAVSVCGIDYSQFRDLLYLMTTRKWSYHSDLGILMGRHSTLSSYLELILMTICGRIGTSGGNLIPGHLMPIGSHSDERDPKTWRTVKTGFPSIMGTFPPNVMPEEILDDNPDRLRAVIVSGANPLRSYADTTAYENAFKELDLLVTIDVAFSETAASSHYVLPARSAYEKWDGTFFSWTYPKIFFQMRKPVVEPEGNPWEESEILIGLAERLGIIPKIPQSLYEAAMKDRMTFGMRLISYIQDEPRARNVLPFIVGKTLGAALGSANLAVLWGLLQTLPKSFRENATRTGFPSGPEMGEAIFKTILDHPEGLWIGQNDISNNFSELKTQDQRINLLIPELSGPLKDLSPESEEIALATDPKFPLILSAGRHMNYNANTIMRSPDWNEGKMRPCSVLMHPDDATNLGLNDEQWVRVTTEAGSEDIELEIDEHCQVGHVVIPHGFGLIYQGRKYGANVNRLTKNTNRDPIAATPLHRFVRCRVEAI